ncbi:CDP-alcohol phosphatidyltransferase family protein [candidate division WOR-3 bacterium]|nr:CDP-alcohol phosphatidyltransferase family protein [candidate division WOR-3 bacterium]
MTPSRNTPPSLPRPHKKTYQRNPKSKTETPNQPLESQESGKKWRFITIPNLLSILRLLLLGPTVWALVHRPPINWLAFAFFVLSSITDALDGWIARRFRQESEWGKILDPVADKVTINTLVMIMAIQGRIPLFLAVVALSRDVIILGACFVLLTSKTLVPQSNWAGKVTGVAFFALLCSGLLNVRWLLDRFLVPIVTVLVLITIVVYSQEFLQYLKTRKKS